MREPAACLVVYLCPEEDEEGVGGEEEQARQVQQHVLQRIGLDVLDLGGAATRAQGERMLTMTQSGGVQSHGTHPRLEMTWMPKS